MKLQLRIALLSRLGEYFFSNEPGWLAAKEKASLENPWFTKEFIDISLNNIANWFLKKDILQKWAIQYNLPEENNSVKSVGVVMAGNIPLVGFHDFLSVFITGNKIIIKPSSKDETLIKHIVNCLISWDKEVASLVQFQEMLKGCDAYIATGSNNSSRYFEYYFRKYPHIIRRNRTSVAILEGNETTEELEKLADDVYLFFGLGCRNVTKIHVPVGYDFITLLSAFKKYDFLSDHHKYRNNYDYRLAIHILNNKFYMTNNSIILFENQSLFSPISQINYEYYSNKKEVLENLKGSQELQCIIGHDQIPFGEAQVPSINDFADKVNTLEFLLAI